MNKKLIPFIGLLFIGVLSGCNNETPTSNPEPTTPPTSTATTIDMNKEMTYSVSVVLPDGSPLNSTSTMAQWCDGDLCFLPVKLNEQGYAETKLMPNTYGLHLLNLPEQYTYDVAGYNPTYENPNITIQLYEINEYEIGETNGPYEPYQLLKEGGYRVSLKSAKHLPYFQFYATRPGVFVVESYTDNLAPIFVDYGSNTEYVENYKAQVNTGGSGKNFRYEYTATSSQLLVDDTGKYIPNSGISFIFAIMLKGQPTYPVNVDFCIRWDREVEEAKVSTEMVKVEEELTKFSKPDNRSLFKCDLNGTVIAIYNEEDGFYHKDSVNGPLITAKITKPITEYEFGDSIADFYAGFGNGAYTFVVEETDFEIKRKDYTELVAAYAEVCNEDGVYPVTKELRTFLILLAHREAYFQEGGYIDEKLDFIVQQSNYWLFACYYYEEGTSNTPIFGQGTSEIPFIVTTGTYNAYYNEEPVYYNLAGDKGKYLIECTNANAILVIDGQNINSSTGFSYEIELTERGSKLFAIDSKAKVEEQFLFTISKI